MEREQWLKQMRSQAEALYDQISPQYWVSFGFYENETHLRFLQKFLDRVTPGGAVLSAGCGAGRYDGILLEAGHPLTGIDQSAGMLKRAQEHFPEAHYEKMGLQEMPFQEEFDGVICIDALEHVCPEDYPGILRNFQAALKPGGMLYFTMDRSASPDELEAAYQRARAKGMPVVFGELVDEVDVSYEKLQAVSGASDPNHLADSAVYHFYPSLEQARVWIEQAGLEIESEGIGSGYHHFLARKNKAEG
jgi:2-polyprenyl-3-methyl-5-hydroxy-6-metoxy-1,4-benzoquinol methylase